MNLTIPTALKVLSEGKAAISYIGAWQKRSKGDARALISELKENLSYLDMVASDGVPLDKVVDKLSVSEYKRLSKEGFNFNNLKKGKLAGYDSLKGTDLEPWIGKNTDALVGSIYEKINEIKIRHPFVGNSKKYRWGVRVNNIRKRVWLLLKHVRN